MRTRAATSMWMVCDLYEGAGGGAKFVSKGRTCSLHLVSTQNLWFDGILTAPSIRATVDVAPKFSKAAHFTTVVPTTEFEV